MMDHAEIERDDVVERYVSGRLEPEELARFEEHYLGCAACCDAVEGAELLREGLTEMAAEEAAQVVARGLLARVLVRARGPLGAALVLALALLPAGLAWRDNRRLATDLAAAVRTLAEERRPRVNTPILTLATRRGEDAVRQISLGSEPEWLVLAVELSEPVAGRYRATLSTRPPSPAGEPEGAAESVIWQSSELVPSYQGVLTLSFHSSLLVPGDYRLGVGALPSGDVRSIPLRVVRRP